MNKKGQISIFVIVGIILAVMIALFFLIDRTPETSRGQDFDNPESYIDNCVKDAVIETVEDILPKGGFQEPRDFKIYDNEKVAYLCKNVNYYEPCINQYPIYLNVLKDELDNVLENKIGQCFTLLEQELSSRNYAVNSPGNLLVNTKLNPGVIEININKKFTMSRGDFSRSFDDFKVFARSSVYDLGFIAREIVTQEARLCYFSTDGFMLTYPKYDIRKYVFSDGTKIYSVKDKNTNEVLNLAIRGCVIPPGF